MFFVLKDNDIVNVSAIMLLPDVQEGAEDTMMQVRMVNGSLMHMHVDDIRGIRELVKAPD